MSRRWIVATCLLGACHQATPTVELASSAPSTDLVVTQPEGVLAAEQAAADEEAQWYAADPERRAQVAAAPSGDACKLRYDSEASVFRVGDVPVFFPLGDDARNSDISGHELHIMQLRQGQTLLVAFTNGDVESALYMGNGEGGPSFADRLWTIDCAQPTRRPQLYFQAPDSAGDVDFGHAVTSGTGDALFVSSRHGISRFVIATKTLEDAIPRMRCTPWETFVDPSENCRRVLLPIALTEHGLEIIAGIPEANCHGGGPTIERYFVDVTSEAIRKDPHRWPRRRELNLLEQVGKDLWISSGSLWRSSDNGLTWDRVDVRGRDDNGQAYDASPQEMLVDARRPRRLLVLASARVMGEERQELFVSDDSGKRWRRLEVQEGGRPILDVWSTDGTLDRLGVRCGELYDDSAESEGFETRDGGKTWSPTEPEVRFRMGSLPHGFELTVLGLWRSGEPRTLVFPPPNLDTPMWIDAVPLEPTVARSVVDWDTWDRSVAANARGLGHAKARRFDAAIAAYTEAWTINPNNVVARYDAARAHALAGNADAAMALIEDLHRIRGYRALTLLAAAADDKALTSLRKLPRFRVLTTASKPSSAFDTTSFTEGRFNIGDMVMSDAAERLCIWAEEAMPTDDSPAVGLARFDCAGPAKGDLRAASGSELAGLLDELGMRAWTKLEASSPDYAKAEQWADALPNTIAAQEVQALFRSPSGKRVAALVTGEDKDGAWMRTVVFGDY